MDSLSEHPLIKEHVVFLINQANARAHLEQSKVNAIEDLSLAIAALIEATAVIDAIDFT